MEVYPYEIREYISQLDEYSKEVTELKTIYDLPAHSISTLFSFTRLTTQVSDLIRIALGEDNFYSKNIDDILTSAFKKAPLSPTPADIKDIQRLVEQAANKYQKRIETKEQKYYVDPKRIEDLKMIKLQDFDLRRLVLLCENINIAYRNGAFLTIPLLIRTILNHIPPIFKEDFEKFEEVINNYSGGKSFKEQMEILNSSMRKLADNYLHSNIGSSVLIPNETQIDQKTNLDVLLSKIISRLNSKNT